MNPGRLAVGMTLLLATQACTRENGGDLSDGSGAYSKVNTDSIAREIRQLSETHAKAATDRDTAAVGSIFAEDARYLPNDDEVSTGGIDEIWQRVVQLPDVVIRYTPKDITVARAGDMAVERGAIEASEKGKPMQVGHYIYVWQQRGEDWKVTDYMWATRGQPVEGKKGP